MKRPIGHHGLIEQKVVVVRVEGGGRGCGMEPGVVAHDLNLLDVHIHASEELSNGEAVVSLGV